MSELLINKVADSGIITIDINSLNVKNAIEVFDIKDYLFMGLILKEKDFREALKQLDLEKYRHKIVAVHCSADAIIPMWAYMLIASLLQPVALSVYFGTAEEAKKKHLLKLISAINLQEYTDKRVVVKGCGEDPIPEEAYLMITTILRPVVKSIMYGEPCSTVPVYKQPKPSE
jgi:hypothetical protein